VRGQVSGFSSPIVAPIETVDLSHFRTAKDRPDPAYKFRAGSRPSTLSKSSYGVYSSALVRKVLPVEFLVKPPAARACPFRSRVSV
jgi:hypothetical protein